MKILVSGGAGFIGSHLVEGFLGNGDEVVVVDDLSQGSLENIPVGARFHRVDIREFEALEQVFAEERPEVACHYAAQVDVRRSMKNPSFDAEVNIVGSVNMMSLAAALGARKFIFASSSAVYPESDALPFREGQAVSPASAYGLSKYVVEQYLRFYSANYGLGYTAFRFGNVYGPRQNPYGEAGVVGIFARQMLCGEQPLIFGDGTKTRDYIHVSDVVSANLRALSGTADGVFNIGLGEEVSDWQVFDAVRKALGVSVEPVYKPRRAGELNRVCLETWKARTELGWVPRMGFAEGIRETVNYLEQSVTSEQS